MLSLTISDTHEQTRSVFLVLAASENREAPDLNKWLSLQKWLEYADHNVIIPFAKPLASIVPTTATRLRRDFQKVLAIDGMLFIRANSYILAVDTRRMLATSFAASSLIFSPMLRQLLTFNSKLVCVGLRLSVA